MASAKQQNKFQNSQGHPLTIPAGDHGITVAQLSPAIEARSVHDDLRTTVFKLELVRDAAGVVTGRNYSDSQTRSEVHRESTVEFICFGKSHLYLAEDYPIVAPYWRDRLLAEAYIRDDSLRYDQKIAEDYLHNKSVIGYLVRAGAAMGDLVTRRKDVPSPDEYQKLRDRVESTRKALAASNAADYDILHEAGLEFARVVSDQDHLAHRVHERVEHLSSVAQKEQVGAEHVEEASFWVMDLYGQVVCRDPVRLFAYRFAVLTVRAGAHAAGTGLSGGHAREAFREAGKVVIQHLPAASTGLILGLWKKPAVAPDDDSILRTTAEQAISIVIFVFFFALDYYLFEADQVPAEQRTHVFIDRLAPELAKQIITAVGAILTHKIAGRMEPGSLQRKQVERLGAVIPVLITSVIGEIARMQSKSTAEHRPFHDVFSAEAGLSLVNIVQAVAQAWLQESIKSRMDAAHTRDQDRLTRWIKDIFKQHTSEPSPPPKPQSVADDEQDPKKNGAAALKPRPVDPAEPLADTPPKPTRKQIREVAKTPAKQRPEPSASDLQKLVKKLGPVYAPEEVEQAVQSGRIRLPKGPGRRGTFVLPVRVRDEKGNVVAEWVEVGKGGRGRPSGAVYAHQLALARVSTGQVEVSGKKISFKMQKDWTVEYDEPYRACRYSPKSRSAVRTPKANASGLVDISEDFEYTPSVDRYGNSVKEVSGELGVPGTVVAHHSRSSQTAISGGSGDDAGHLIAARFGAACDERNLSLQNFIQNRGGGNYYDLEDKWAAKLLSGTKIQATVQDITKPGEDRAFRRHVIWTETDPDGTVTHKTLDFVNTHTPKSRDKQGVPATPQPVGHTGSVTRIY